MTGRGFFLKNLQKSKETPPPPADDKVPTQKLDQLHLDDEGKFDEAVGGEPTQFFDSPESKKFDVDSALEKSPDSEVSSFLSCARGRGRFANLLANAPKAPAASSESRSQTSIEIAAETKKEQFLGIAGRGRGLARSSDSSGLARSSDRKVGTSDASPSEG